MTSSHPTIRRLKAWVDALTAPFVSRDEAEKFLIYEQAHHPEDIEALSHQMVLAYITGAMTDRSNKLRAASRRDARRVDSDRYVAAVAKADAEGEPRPRYSMFTRYFTVSEDNTRKPVARMTGRDHLFVAGRYDDDARISRSQAAFHKAVAKKTGPDGVTGDVMDEETYARLYNSITREAHPDAA